MARSAFMDRNSPPHPEEVQAKLGDRCTLWDMFQDYLRENESEFIQQWSYHSKKMGWVLDIRHADTALVSLIPCNRSMRFCFYFSEELMNAIEAQGMHPQFEKMVRGARKAADGRTFEFEARRVEDLEVARQIIDLKRQFS